MIAHLPANDYNALLATATKNDVRFYLNGIYIDIADNVAVATDGHAMLIAPVKIVKKGGHDSFILPRLPNAPAGGEVLIDCDAKTVTYSTKSGITKPAFHYTPVDGTYPDYQRVIPNEGELQDTLTDLSFNPLLMSRVLQPLKLSVPGVRVRSAPLAGSALRIDIHGRDDLILVVMPIRW